MRLIAVTCLALFGIPGSSMAAEPELDRLKRHVETLADPSFLGRRDEGAAKARDYLIAEFHRLGLTPLFGESFRQDVVDAGGGTIGVNVGAKLGPTEPRMGDEWVVLGVHFDHLGVMNGTIYPGADDNATAVAMMLEVARSFVESPAAQRRGVIFVGFDLEERGPKGEFGLRGSQFFVAHPPIPLERIRLFVTADMIGRSMAGLFPDDVFVLGSEREPGVRPWIDRAATGQPVRVNLVGADVLGIDRSDYGPFRLREVPYLFFTTGESRVYHRPEDVAATIDYPKLAAISQIMNGTVRRASEEPSLPGWSAVPDHPIAEATALRRVFQTLIDPKAGLRISAYQSTLIRSAIRTAEVAEARGSMTEAERTAIVRAAQVVLFTVL